MYRKAFFALLVVCCLSTVAYPNPIISLGNWKINLAANQSIDLNTGQPIAVMIETPGGPPEDQIAAVNLALSVNALTEADLITLPGPLIESVSIGAGTVFTGNNLTSEGIDQNSIAGLGPLPARRSYTGQATAQATVDAGDGAGGPAVLAFLSFDASGVAPGTYPIYLTFPKFDSQNMMNLVIPTTVPPFFTPTLLDGSVDNDSMGDMDGSYGTLTVIPEPGSILLALFAAGGLCVAAIGRRRKCRPRNR